MTKWSLDPVGGGYLVALLFAVGLLGLLALGPPRTKTRGLRRAALTAIRTAVIFMLLAAMLRPTLVYTEMTRQPATLVLMFDKSRSMSVPDGIGGKTRYEILRRAVDDARDALGALAEDYEVKAYVFDGEIHPVEVEGGLVQLPEVPDGTQTAIGSDLEDVLAREAGKRLLGIVLMSDGAQQFRPPRDVPAQTAAARIETLGYKLHTFPLGQSRGLGQAKDVRLVHLQANPTVFVKNELVVSGDVQVDGYVNRGLRVKLLFEESPGEMKEVAWDTVEATSDGQRVPVHLSFVPEQPGEFKLSLEVEEQPGELVTTNNQLSTFVHVLKGGLNVFYLEGALRVESKFLRRSLGASPDIQVDYFRVRRDPAAAPDAKPEVKFVRPPGLNMAEALKPGKYEVYILGDVDSAAFRPEELEQLADRVSNGAGLVMLGGFHSFGPGGYGQTPLGRVLPVKMSRFERQVFDGEIRPDTHLKGPLRMKPSGVGLIHFALMLGAGREGNLAAWGRLPPLEGANKFGEPLPGALTLAEDDGGNPIMVSHHYGNGRVLAMAADSTWRWWMQGFADAHRRFWRQIVLWLAKKDESSEGAVWVRVQPRRFAPGQRVEFVVGTNNPAGEPVADARFTAEAVLPDGRRMPVQLVRGDNQHVGSFRETNVPGDYTIEVTATTGGAALGSARARFIVFRQDLELDNAAADVDGMKSLAKITDGESLAPEQLSALLERLTRQSTNLEVEQVRKVTFWDTWPFFLALVALLGVEWFLRKRWGLV